MKTIQDLKDEEARCYNYYDNKACESWNDFYSKNQWSVVGRKRIQTAMDEVCRLYASQFQQSGEVELPSDSEIENQYPSGGTITMEDGLSYFDVIKLNYYRRQGAKWMREEIRKRNK